MPTNRQPLERAVLALEGLSVGDAFGERFFVHPDVVERLIELQALPAPLSAGLSRCAWGLRRYHPSGGRAARPSHTGTCMMPTPQKNR
jgi:hypothetical protein